MADIQPLIEYLKINRTKDALEAEDAIVQIEVIDQNYDIDNESGKLKDVYKSHIDETLRDTWKLSTFMSFNEFDSIYIRVLDNFNYKDSIQYYNRKNFETDSGDVIKYRKLGQDNWNEFPDVEFITIPLIQLSSSYYYDYTIERIIIYNSFETVVLVENALPFKPDALGIKSGRHTLEYVDHEGYDNGLFDQTLKLLLDPLFKFAMDKAKRKIDVEIAKDEGKIHLFPIIKGSGNNIVLKYMYKKGRFSRFDIKHETPAITLRFHYFGAFLEFINQTVFYVKDIQSLNWDEPLNLDEVFELIYKSITFDSENLDPELVEKYNQGGIRQLFIDQYTDTVISELRIYRKHLHKSLEILYYTPKILIKYLRLSVLWDIVGRSLEVNLTNIGLNKEDVVLKLLESVYEKIGDTQLFLDELFTKRTSYQSNYFTALYKKLHTGNFTKYILLLIEQWKQSSYANMEKREYVKLGDSVLNPVICGYTSGKSWSFYHENTNFEWTVDGYITIEVTTENEGVKNYEYHPYDLIAISNAENENISFTGQQLEHISFLPAFALFAHSDVTFWKNTLTAAEYTGDVISLAVGLGPAWRSFRIVSALANAATTTHKVFVVARSAIGVMEVTAGTANIILKATQYRDTEFGRKLANVFIWMEFASLGADVALGVAKRLSASAKLALTEADKLLRAANKSKADKLLDAVKRKNGEIVAIARLTLTEFKQMGHLLLGNLEGARYIVAQEFRLLAGAIANDIKAVGVQLLELTGETVKALDNLGDDLLRSLGINRLDFQYAVANGGYLVTHNGKGFFASKLDDVKGFFNAMGDHLKKGAGRGGKTGKNIDKVDEAFEVARIKKLLEGYIARRAELLKLDEVELLALFKGRIEVKHFNTSRLLSFRKKMLNKYPLLKHHIDPGTRRKTIINFAEFIINSSKNGKKVHKNHKVLSHSGRKKLYDTFTDTIADKKFIENLVDLDGIPKYNDSEIKFVYEFLTKHLNKADEFIIETKNVYFTCTSCQRELIMLIDIAESLGKKTKFIVHGDESIKGWAQLKELIK